MPTIREYAGNLDVSLDVDVNDFLDECSDREIKHVIEWLVDSDWINEKDIPDVGNIMEIEWNKTIDKLSTLRLQLTPEEEEIIKTIVNKY